MTEPPAGSRVGRVAVSYRGDPRVLTVNLATAPTTVGQGPRTASTGIVKSPAAGEVWARAPGDRRTGLGSGLVGDTVVSRRHHGGDDQAVYAYAREELDHFAGLLGRDLANGSFGENLTTAGLDVSGALIGERWRIGPDGPLLAVRGPRIPCGNFRAWIGARGWLRTFDRSGLSGAYLAVLEPGPLRAAAAIIVTDRPDHGVRVCDVYRAMTSEPDRWPDVLAAGVELSDEAREMGRAGQTYRIG